VRLDHNLISFLSVLQTFTVCDSIKPNTSFGGFSGEVTPVPIPNTEVKLSSADGTAWATVWESRALPDLKNEKPLLGNEKGFFVLTRSVPVIFSF
jgi:hypothetical protein